jgi:hypothetical protein
MYSPGAKLNSFCSAAWYSDFVLQMLMISTRFGFEATKKERLVGKLAFFSPLARTIGRTTTSRAQSFGDGELRARSFWDFRARRWSLLCTRRGVCLPSCWSSAGLRLRCTSFRLHSGCGSLRRCACGKRLANLRAWTFRLSRLNGLRCGLSGLFGRPRRGLWLKNFRLKLFGTLQ